MSLRLGRRSSPGRAVVLMWHRIGDGAIPGREPGEDAYAVPAATFERQLDVLARPGATAIGFDRVIAAALEGEPLPPRAVALTFDDGNGSDHEHVLPSLARRRLQAAFFVSPARIGTPTFLTWDQVRDLAREGMVIGAHGLDHTSLSTLDDQALRLHLGEARRLMEARLGSAPRLLSLPGGAGGPRVVAIAREAGFTLVLDSTPRRYAGGPPGLPLPRFAVRRTTGLGELGALVGHAPRALLREALRAGGLGWLRRGLGEARYARLRQALLDRAPVGAHRRHDAAA